MSGVVKQSNIRTVLHEILRPITSKMAIATSGGIDSASLVMAAQDLGKKQIIVSFTFDDFESHDFKSARLLAKHFNIDFLPVILPSYQNEIVETVHFLIKEIKCKKKSAIECMFPFVYLLKVLKKKKIDTLVTGLAADGHFGLSKKAMIHYSKDDKKFKQLRQEYFSTYESAHIVRLQQLCNNNQILLQNPYFSPLVFDLWIDKNWQELNKPRQKEAIKKYFPELDKFKIKPHTNLQLGDSKIAQRVGSAVVSKYKPYAKSPVGIYNRIAKGIYA
jgi:asparagine synthetase B (glutamine-hydrolysing)